MRLWGWSVCTARCYVYVCACESMRVSAFVLKVRMENAALRRTAMLKYSRLYFSFCSSIFVSLFSHSNTHTHAQIQNYNQDALPKQWLSLPAQFFGLAVCSWEALKQPNISAAKPHQISTLTHTHTDSWINSANICILSSFYETTLNKQYSYKLILSSSEHVCTQTH